MQAQPEMQLQQSGYWPPATQPEADPAFLLPVINELHSLHQCIACEQGSSSFYTLRSPCNQYACKFLPIS